jgi:hypothetical protein
VGVTGRGRLDFNGHNDPVAIAKAQELISWQSDDAMMSLYKKYQNNKMIRWKESIQKVIKNHA